MGWGGIDLIPLRDGESPQDAVDRVHSGGAQITFVDGVPVVETIEPDPAIEEVPAATNCDWRLEAIELLEAQVPGWVSDPPVDGVVPEEVEQLILEHAEAPFWALVTPTYVNLNRMRRGPAAEGDWTLWWQTVQRFAGAGCAAFHPDTSELLDPSLDDRAANERYLIL